MIVRCLGRSRCSKNDTCRSSASGEKLLCAVEVAAAGTVLSVKATGPQSQSYY